MLRIVLHIWMVFGLCVGLTACGNTDDVPVQEQKTPVKVEMTLVVDRGLESRALVDGTEVDGTGYENFIDIANNDFRFYLFTEENLYIDEIKVHQILPIDQSNYPSVYYVKAELEDTPPSNFKVVVLANWPTYPTGLTAGESTIASICTNSLYDYVQPFVPSATQKIPMYGVHTYEGMSFESDEVTDLERLKLVRAMAKVEVLCEAEGYEVVDAKMSHFSGWGMAAPKGIYTQTDEIKNNWTAAMQVDFTHINTGETPFPVSGTNSRIIYVPEYQNIGATYPAEITVWLKVAGADDATAKPYPIYFKEYADGKPTDVVMDIIRNHYYQFVVKKVNAGIDVGYTVVDWDHEESKHHWVQDYTYPTYGNVVPWSYVTTVANPEAQTITLNPEMYYHAGNWIEGGLVENIQGAFEVGFQMTAPEGQQWKPAIHGSNQNYEIRVYRWENGILVYKPNPRDWIASNHWYKIQLIPKEAEYVGQTVDFGISTTLDWANQTLFLLINGQDAQTIRWPNSGSDARIIQVKQIAEPVESE